ncbi:MAG: 4-(cytidine 5'-diphospho)-2-C-methyl-D-erythritol kinase [Rhizobacter sp.]|nr:4-(cytidine 5'-diphospho)-2-C-methyl-D-erythritol kinase [Chlorobiales bacterium]
MTKILKAYAKINLALFITAKRADGYHDLETVFAPINWFDELHFSPSETLSMTCSDAGLPADDSNLCMKAAGLLRAESGTKRGIKIHLQKNVPSGAGLGGGSSDAATVLRHLNEAWQLHLPPEALLKLASALGADVAYFLSDAPLVYATGKGEVLEPLEFSLPYAVVTLFPHASVSTVWAYKNFKLKPNRTLPDLKAAMQQVCLNRNAAAFSLFENDFEAVVFEHYPQVKAAKAKLLDAGAVFASLSGSGSAVFGVFNDDRAALNCYDDLRRSYPASLTPADFRRSPRKT